KVKSLECQLSAVREELINEKQLKEGFCKQIEKLRQDLSSEKMVSELSSSLKQQSSFEENLLSEVQAQKDINKEQVEKIERMEKALKDSRQATAEKDFCIEIMQQKTKDFSEEAKSTASELHNTKQLLEEVKRDLQEKTKHLGHLENQELEAAKATAAARRESTPFHDTIETMRRECEQILKVSSRKSQQIQELEQVVDSLRKQVMDLENEIDVLKQTLTVDSNSLKEKEALVNRLKENLEEAANNLDSEKLCALETKKQLSLLQEETVSQKQIIKELEGLLKASSVRNDDLEALKEKLQERETMLSSLKKNLTECQEKLKDSEKNIVESNLKVTGLNEEVSWAEESLKVANEKLSIKETELEEKSQQLTDLMKLQKELENSSASIKCVTAALQRKEEEHSDLKEKLADAKKQIHQVHKEVSLMREEEKLLRNKLDEQERIKKKMNQDLDGKEKIIRQLKMEYLFDTKAEKTLKLYQATCKDLQDKEKIIEDMRITLIEQEQTQAEQDQVLESKVKKIECLTSDLNEWEKKYNHLENKYNQIRGLQRNWNKELEVSEEENIDKELVKLTKTLKECEEKHKTDRKKWLEEKMALINQAKEAEDRRNKDMKKYVEDRERYTKLQTEVEKLHAQLDEKENNLLKWREERDQLVAALEVQLKNLIATNVQKDKELQELQVTVSKKRDKRSQIREQKAQSFFFSLICTTSSVASVTEDSEVSKKDLVHSDVVLDSLDVSTESRKTSRFPKPELEIQFTPLQPNKMAVKHQGNASTVTVKINQSGRKRKSWEMEEGNVKHENKKNDTKSREPQSNPKQCIISKNRNMEEKHSLKKQASFYNTRSINKKDGTFQKIGDFLQSSPTFLQTKAKKLMETLNSPKSPEVESGKTNEFKRKRSKRKLYKTDISVPLDIPSCPIVMDQEERESDHLIIKRRLRTRTVK
uniref:KI20B protein n=1 Tax=Latimeria chalumnae TaxID=7897 RepID=H3A3P1_LATCH